MRRPAHAAPVSAAMVAADAGVSIATVSRVLNCIGGKASPQTAERVRRIAAELGYRPGRAGGALRQGRTRLVAVLAPNLANPAMAAIAAAIEAALRQAGLVMVLCDTQERADIQDEYLLEMRAQLVRATILLGAVASPELERQVTAGERLLFVNRRNPDGRAAAFVGIDNEQAGRDVAEFFLARRLPVFGVIAASTGSSAVQARLAGFYGALERPSPSGRRRRDLKVPPAKQVEGSRREGEGGADAETVLDGGQPMPRTPHPDPLPEGEGEKGFALNHVQAGMDGVARLLAQGVVPQGGLFCASDLVAYGAARALVQAGVAPGAVTIIGFDDNPLNDLLAPWLSSVRIPYAQFGRAVADALARMAHAETPVIVLPHQLIDRTRVEQLAS